MKYALHVNPGAHNQNRQDNGNRPVWYLLALGENGLNRIVAAKEVNFLGSCWTRTSQTPLSPSGAHLWLETEGPIQWHNGDGVWKTEKEI